MLEEQVGKLSRALEILKEEINLLIDKADKLNTTPVKSPAQEEKYQKSQVILEIKLAISQKADGELASITVNGKKSKASDLSFRVP